MENEFEKWIFEVVKILHKKSKKDETEIYCNLDLSNAKASFLDNDTPNEYIEYLENNF